MYANLFNPRRSKEPTWEDLLDRESKEKDGKRSKRENVIPLVAKKQPDGFKEDVKSKKIIDLEKEFEQLKSKIRHVENKNERMLSQLRIYNPDDEPIQDRPSPILGRSISRGRTSPKQSFIKTRKNPERNYYEGILPSLDFSQQIVAPSQYNRGGNKLDLKALVDCALSLKKKQEVFEKVLTNKTRVLEDRIVEVQQLAKMCNEFMGLKDHSAIENSQSNDIFNMKSKQLELIISELERDKDKLKSHNEELVAGIEDYKMKLQTHKESYEKEIDELRARSLKKLAESESKCQKLIMQHAEEIEQIRKEYTLLSLENSRAWRQDGERHSKESQFEMLKLESQHLNSLVAQLKTELKGEKAKILVVSGQRDKAQFELQKLQLAFSFDDHSQELANHKAESEVMANQLTSLRKDKEQLEIQINNLRRQNKEYLLKITKKEEFRVQIEEAYKSKLRQEGKLLNNLREEKKRIQLETLQLKSLNKSLLSQKERFGNELAIEVKKMLQLENDAVIRTVLQNYASSPQILALEVMRISTQRKITQQEYRKKLVERRIVSDKDYTQNVKIEFFAIEQLWDENKKYQKQLEDKQHRFREKEEEWAGQRQAMKSNMLKYRRTIEELKRSHEEDLRSSQSQYFKEDETSKFNEMKSLILKAESEKKELQNRLIILELETDNLNEARDSLDKKRQRLQAEKQEIKVSLQKELGAREEKIRKLETDVREAKEEYIKKKAEMAVQNKRLEYNLSELEIKLQRASGWIEQKQLLLAQKEEQLRRRKEETGSMQSQVRQLSKRLLQLENQNRKQGQELNNKRSQALELSSTIQGLTFRLSSLEGQIKEKQYLLVKIGEQKDNNQGTLSLMKENEVFLKKNLQKWREQAEGRERAMKEAEELRLRVQEMEDELQQKNERITAALEEQNVYTYNLEHLTNVHNKKVQKLEDKLKELEEKNRQLSGSKIIETSPQVSLYNSEKKFDKRSQKDQELAKAQQSQQFKLKQMRQSIEKRQVEMKNRQKDILSQTTKMLTERAKLQTQRSRLAELASSLKAKEQQIRREQSRLKRLQLESSDKLIIPPTLPDLRILQHQQYLEEDNDEGAQPFQFNPQKEFELEGYDVSENFEIGDAKSRHSGSPNTIITEFFLRIKSEIEKIVYGQELSVQIYEVIPAEIENEFQELLKLIHDKVQSNELSFIFIDQFNNVDTMLGDSIMEEYPDLNSEVFNLKKKVSEQEQVIENLTSERAIHQNNAHQVTHQLEQIEEQKEARFIVQLTILKQQLKEAKVRSDMLEVTVVATKKTLFTVLEILVSDRLGLEEELAEALNYYSDVAKVTEKERKQLADYFDMFARLA